MLDYLEERTLLSATYTVDALTDTGAGSGLQGDLLYAIDQANSHAGSTIQFSVTGTITLTGALPALSQNVTITGPGASSLTVSGDNEFRVFEVDANVTASISGLTIADGSAGSVGRGGGLLNYGTATLTNCTVTSNYAKNGGGVDSFVDPQKGGNAELLLSNCIVSGNSAEENGGGVDVTGGTATLNNCTVSGNSSGSTARNQFGRGGGIEIEAGARASLTNCTVSGNSVANSTSSGYSAGAGLRISQAGLVTLTNCTVSGNSGAQYGGGVSLYATTGTKISDCTVSGNSAAHGGGLSLSALLGNNPASATLANTIVAGNTATVSGPDAFGTFTSHHGNLIGETDGSSGWATGGGGDLGGTIANPLNPELAPLGNYGGPTPTMALLFGSPAINAGSVGSVPSGVTTDQRGPGYPRIVNSTVDIGAFEGTGIPTTTAVQTSAASSTYGQSVTFTATVSDGGGVPTGSVEFYNGTTVLGPGSSLSGSGNSATSMLTTSMVAAGTNLSIRAVYTPTGNFVGGSGSVSQTVNKATLTITAVGGFKAYGSSMLFFSTEFNETGLVTANGDTITGVTDTSAGAKASATVTSPGPTYAVVPSAATGTGLSNYNITYVSGTLTVFAAATSTTVASSRNPSIDGQSVSFTAKVSNASGTSPMPAGSVQFSVHGTNLGNPVTLSSNGTASISDSPNAGTHSVTAVFNAATGNSNFSTSTGSLSGGQVVNPQIHTFIVMNVNDSGPGSLRAAVTSANADTNPPPGGDTIGFAPSLAGGRST
jgi:fibronectin-binding autotransporter adhesin